MKKYFVTNSFDCDGINGIKGNYLADEQVSALGSNVHKMVAAGCLSVEECKSDMAKKTELKMPDLVLSPASELIEEINTDRKANKKKKIKE